MDLANFLDKSIKRWEERKKKAVSKEGKYAASCYLDAYQSVKRFTQVNLCQEDDHIQGGVQRTPSRQ